jgi:hypothetical protein
MQGRVEVFTIVFQPGRIFKPFSIPAEKLTSDDFDEKRFSAGSLGNWSVD